MLGMVIKFLSGIVDYYQFYPYEGWMPLVGILGNLNITPRRLFC